MPRRRRPPWATAPRAHRRQRAGSLSSPWHPRRRRRSHRRSGGHQQDDALSPFRFEGRPYPRVSELQGKESPTRSGRRSNAANPDDPVGQLYGFVEQAAKFIVEDERGCDLANAAVELTEEGHPGLRVIEEFKVRQRDRLAALCEPQARHRPSLLADALILLIEGARVSRRSVGTEVRARISCGPAKRCWRRLASNGQNASQGGARPRIVSTGLYAGAGSCHAN